METISLTVEPRQTSGKGEAGRTRRNGQVPGVFYGPGKQATSLLINAREFHFKLAGLEGSHLIQLSSSLPEFKDRIAILKEVQRHPLTNNLVHVDLYEVDVNKPLQVTVALHFVGKAEGVVAGGNLQSLMREIMVECLPRDIPEFVEVDVSPLKIHDSIRIMDIALPAGVRAISETNESVVTVTAQVVVAPAAPAEGEAVAAAPAAAAPVEPEKK
jgi:large subunit ribosomal protein L25